MADLADNQTEVWAHHWQAVELFQQMNSQWRVGFGGAVGLDYAVLFKLMNLYDIEKHRQPEILAQIQVMESAALAIFYEKQK